MKRKYIEWVERRILDKCIVDYKFLDGRINLKMGAGLFNHRCFYNAVQAVKDGRATEVWMCITGSKHPILHFVNKDKGKWVDNTLGYCHSAYDYYIIRQIDPNEYNRIDDIFTTTRNTIWRGASIPFLDWLFFIKAENEL